MGTSGKSGQQIEIYDYTMSMHQGICAYGEGIELIGLKYGDKEMWRGSLTEAGQVAIMKPNLFGGPKKEGGVKGLAWWLPGGPDQTMPESLASRLGLTAATCPGYRGVSSVFFTGDRNSHLLDIVSGLLGILNANPGKNKKGFYWGSNNPYLRDMAMRVRRPSIGLDPDIALIRMPDDSKGNQQYASNPAHMVYEALTNKDWGMGENPAVIDKDSFEAGAQTLYDEGFGLNMIWTRQSEVGKFIGEINTHIQAAVFVRPSTGKHTFKLLRADYDVDELPVISPSNATLSTFKRKVWGEISNEVVVTMTNSETGKEETVTAQDLAGIAAEGGIVSSSQNYYGITSQELAIRVANRDLAASVNPIATCEAVVTRQFWDTVSSDVVLLSWPEYGIERLVFRVQVVDKDDDTVTLGLYEDIFGLDQASYLQSGGTQWENPSQPPTPATRYQIGTAPAFMTVAALGKNDASELEYPEVLSALTVGADSDDDLDYDLQSYVTDVNGTTTRSTIGTRPYRSNWVLLDGLAAEAVSVLPTLSGLRGPDLEPGDFILIGTGSDPYTEIATVQLIDDDGYHINRGMLDTIPRAWAAGTRAFGIASAASIADPTVRASNEAVPYWLLPRTTAGLLAEADAPQINITLSERPYYPNRPADVKVNGKGFGSIAILEDDDFVVSWANRNRILEAAQALKWTDADVAPEDGQTTRLTVTRLDGTTIKTYGGLTGNSYSIPRDDLGSTAKAKLIVAAERDTYQSLQPYVLDIVLGALTIGSVAFGAASFLSATRSVSYGRSISFNAVSGLIATHGTTIPVSATFSAASLLTAETASGFGNGFDSGFR
jgi:hypothetical protein